MAELAARLRVGLASLRAGRPAEAIDPLLEVASDEALAAQGDLRDVRARACSLLAQALLEAGRAREAEPWVHEAARLARELEDREGQAQVQALMGRVAQEQAEAHQRRARERRLQKVAAIPLAELLEGVEGPARLAILVEKANADLADGRPGDAAAVAGRALGLASEHGDVRHEVLVRLVLARAEPERAGHHLHAAWSRAERAEAIQLVAAVAQAAEDAGVSLPRLEGPSCA